MKWISVRHEGIERGLHEQFLANAQSWEDCSNDGIGCSARLQRKEWKRLRVSFCRSRLHGSDELHGWTSGRTGRSLGADASAAMAAGCDRGGGKLPPEKVIVHTT